MKKIVLLLFTFSLVILTGCSLRNQEIRFGNFSLKWFGLSGQQDDKTSEAMEYISKSPSLPLKAIAVGLSTGTITGTVVVEESFPTTGTIDDKTRELIKKSRGVLLPPLKIDIPSASGKQNNSPSNSPRQDKFLFTLHDLYMKGGEKTCSITSKDSSVTGTLYIQGKIMRFDMRFLSDGTLITTSAIIKNNYVYTRTDGEKFGGKFAYDKNMRNKTSTLSDMSFSFDCKAGISDSHVLDIPNIEFTQQK